MCFAVPLRSSGYGLGVVARANPKAALLGYFFGPKRATLPNLDDVSGLGPGDAVWVAMFGHLGLRDGAWPILGQFNPWNRKDWPMPDFRRYEELTGRRFRVIYDDDDPAMLLREELASASEIANLPEDGLAGAGFVELRLTRLLDGDAG